MKLFYQLNEEQQEKVVKYCMNHVMDDMFDDGLDFDPQSEEDEKIKNKIEDALSKAITQKTKSEKVKILLEDQLVYQAIYSIALEMAKNAFYHEDDELAIFPNSLEVDDNELSKVENPKNKDKNLN